MIRATRKEDYLLSAEKCSTNWEENKQGKRCRQAKHLWSTSFLGGSSLCNCFAVEIGNSNWTEWSTIQGVIARVISKSDEREARGRFEITSTITP